ncbi:MAG: glycosyltransferase [Henriciella sp.]
MDDELTYKSRLNAPQQATISICLACLGIGGLLFPGGVARIAPSLLFTLFFAMIAWRSTLLFAGWVLRRSPTDRTVPHTADSELPIYSILIPAYREQDLMGQIAMAMNALDWPADRLDIILLLEADDTETLIAAEAAPFPAQTRLCIIPPGGPRTKPNALNHGLHHAIGDFVTVYDVEDLPDPSQLRATYQAFKNSPAGLVCLQAPLVADNADQSWLAAQWALEYAIQFRLLLPGLSLYQMPLLLGGTSNHFRKEALLSLGGWDAWNVTEDADLGMRLARASLCSATISVPTYEDAPTRPSIWMAQRSRWIKGHIQTWLVLMRKPVKTCRQMGFVAFISMQLSLGAGILAPLFHAPCFAFVAAALVLPEFELALAGSLLLASGLANGLTGGLAAPGPWTVQRVLAILTQPFYWPLHSFAAYRAIWELAKNPFFWAKTPHRPRPDEGLEHCSTGSSASASPPV